MQIHKVKSPFLCRIGQFKPDERHLCIGIKTQALQSKKEHIVEVGKMQYVIDCEKALKCATDTNSFIKDGDVAIVPFELVAIKTQAV